MTIKIMLESGSVTAGLTATVVNSYKLLTNDVKPFTRSVTILFCPLDH